MKTQQDSESILSNPNCGKKVWSKPTVELIAQDNIQSGVNRAGTEAGSGPVYVS